MPSIQLYDTTLRDGAQREGISLSVVDKLNITQKLDELGIHYMTLDEILWFFIEKNNNPDEIIKLGYEREIVEKVVNLVKRTKFKRYKPPAPVLRRYNYKELV